jgi:hypothetical protein
MNSKNKNIRDLYRGINGIVKDENSDLLADSHNILDRWKNCFSQLLNVHRVSDVRHIEVHRFEPLVPDSNPFEFHIAIAKLKRLKMPGSDQIPAIVFKQEAKYYVLRSRS